MTADLQREPVVVSSTSATVLTRGNSPVGVRLSRLITREACGAELLLGIQWLEAGDEVRWSFERTDRTSSDEAFYGPTEEVYFVLTGELRLAWANGELEFRRDDAVYVPPGYRYVLTNIGSEEAHIVYVMCPAPT